MDKAKGKGEMDKRGAEPGADLTTKTQRHKEGRG